MFESELRRSAQLTPAFLPSVPNTSIIEGERQVHLWAKCLSQKLSQEAKPPGTKPSTSLRGTEKPFAQTKSVRLKTVRYTCDSLACGRQHRLEQEEAVFPCTRGLTWCACPAVLEADVSLLLRPDTRAGDPPLRSVHVPGPLALTPTHTHSHSHGGWQGGQTGPRTIPAAGTKEQANTQRSAAARVCVCVFVGAQQRWPRSPSLSSLTFQAGSSQIWLELEDASLFPSLACSLLWLSLFPRWASFLFISSWESCTHRSSLHPLPLSLSPQSLVNIKEMLVRPLPLSPSLSLSLVSFSFTLPPPHCPHFSFSLSKLPFKCWLAHRVKESEGEWSYG